MPLTFLSFPKMFDYSTLIQVCVFGLAVFAFDRCNNVIEGLPNFFDLETFISSKGK